MKEFSKYIQKEYKDLNDWLNRNVDVRPPILPMPDIKIKNGSLEPQKYNAKVNDYVTWISDDSLEHKIRSEADSGNEFSSPDSGVLALITKGSKFSHQFTSVNSYDYFCEKHPDTEVGKVTITDNVFYIKCDNRKCG